MILKHVVTPLVGFDALCFGEKRSVIRKYYKEVFDLEFTTFDQGNGSILAENYTLFNVYYDSHDCCQAVEFSNDCEVWIGEVSVLPGTVEQLVKLYPDIDRNMISIKQSIGIYAPDGEEIEALLFGTPNYYV